MLRIRIVSAGVVAAIAVTLAAGAAAAQTATESQAGKPLALLAGLRPPHEHKAHMSKATVHGKTAAKMSKKTAAKKSTARTNSANKERRRIAAEQSGDPPAPLPSNPVPASLSPVETSAPNPVAAAQAAAAPSQTAAPDDRLVMSAIVVDGQTVQVASPDQVNAIDLAADDSDAAKAVAPSERTDAAQAVRTVFAAPIHKDESPSPVGSASWIAQVLAALGGAVTAGTVAWFLIGGGPQRMYG
jgi:hypothetical protein